MRDLVLENRIVVSPMCQWSAHEGLVQPWHYAHLCNLAISGAGLIIVEATAVEAGGRISNHCLGLYTDEQETALARIVTDASTISSVPFGIQLAHSGRKGSCHRSWEWKMMDAGNVDWGKGKMSKVTLSPEEGAWPVIGPSAIAYDEGWQVPREMDRADLDRVRAAFADAAKRADRCGFQLIELHAAHGYLLHSFLSPISNKRTDAYGGMLENRALLLQEIVEEIRGNWPKSKPIGVRITGSDWTEGGLESDDAVQLSRLLASSGVDYVVASAGGIAPDIRVPDVSPAYMLEFVKAVRGQADIARMAVGMIYAPEQAEAIIASGDADLVAIGRGFLDDPRWAIHAAVELGRPIGKIHPRFQRTHPSRWIAYSSMHPPQGDGSVYEGKVP
jgi:2,4-dienoyl-CoA reductase-like NADH-dependent reductase (Old Yellow Enzyme family)